MMVKQRTLCYHCGIESTENAFKYYDNGKRSQPRYQCGNCQKCFTLGSHGRPQRRNYTKQRNVDPPELKGLARECRCCGVADNAPFKYYNNKSPSQPRFKCLSCGQLFQMRLMGMGEERRLVHTSSCQRPSTKQQDLAPNSDDDDDDIGGQMQVAENPWMPTLDSNVESFPSLSIEDAKYFDLIEAGVKSEKEAPPPMAVLRLQLWASKLPQSCRESSHSRMPLNQIHGPLANAEG